MSGKKLSGGGGNHPPFVRRGLTHLQTTDALFDDKSTATIRGENKNKQTNKPEYFAFCM